MKKFKKIGVITLIVCVVGFVASQLYTNHLSTDIESYTYEVVKKYDRFEIRLYEEALFSYVTMPYDSYTESSTRGFSVLAGYIFGGNEESEEIAMTSPVEMEMNDSITMKFMVPKKYTIEDVPKPDNSSIAFKKEPKKYLAAIRFGGFADDAKIQHHIELLKELLKNKGIKHQNNFSFLGYNPPFQVINRTNEIVVEIDKDALGY